MSLIQRAYILLKCFILQLAKPTKSKAVMQNFLWVNLIPALEVSSSSLTCTQYSLSPHLLNF